MRKRVKKTMVLVLAVVMLTGITSSAATRAAINPFSFQFPVSGNYCYADQQASLGGEVASYAISSGSNYSKITFGICKSNGNNGFGGYASNMKSGSTLNTWMYLTYYADYAYTNTVVCLMGLCRGSATANGQWTP